MITQETIANQQFPVNPGEAIRYAGQWVTVTHCQSWWCEDPLSFGVLDGRDCDLYDWTVRAATPEEIAAGEQREADEQARAAQAAAEKQRRVEAARAERQQYKERLAALQAQFQSARAGLEKLANAPSLSSYTCEELGELYEPGRGASSRVAASVWRDSGGVVVAAAWHVAEFGTDYYGNAVIAQQGNSQQRVMQWWNPKGYGADSYPGPGVPREELTPDELALVEQYETAKRAELIRRQVFSWEAWAKYSGAGATVALVGEQIVVTVPPSVRAKAEQNLAQWNRLNADKTSSCYQKSPLPVAFQQGRELATVKEALKRVLVAFPEQPALEVRQQLKAAGFRFSKGAWGALRSEPNVTLANQLVTAYNAHNAQGE